MRLIAVLLLTAVILCGCQQLPFLEPTQVKPPETTVSTQPQTTAPTQPETTSPVTEPATEVFAAGESQTPLPKGTILCQTDIGGLTPIQALMLIDTVLDNYQLSLTINGEELILTGEDLGLCCDPQKFDQYIQQCLSGQELDVTGLWSYDAKSTEAILRKLLETPASNVFIEYNQNAKQFVPVSAKTGTGYNLKNTMEVISQAVRDLSPTATASADSYVLLPKVSNNNALLPTATDLANSYLSLSLFCTYEAPGQDTVTEEIRSADIASFLLIDEQFHVSVNRDAILGYVAALAGKHGGSRTTGKFITANGTLTDRTVKYYDAVIDQDDMYSFLLACLENKESGSYTAKYIANENNLPYGGNYVEVSLTDQQLWIYQNGKIAVTTPFVSGDVPSGAWTGGGVFTVEDKDTTCWLVGSSFRDYVEYWIGFNGKIGIHDASWRTDFGNQIYMYDGSHGCINIPSHNGRLVYDGLALDSKVIVYGGKTGAEQVIQELDGIKEYTLTTDDAPFHLDITALHPGSKMTYSSSDPRVVNVSPSGLVTVIGPGQAQITVVCQSFGFLQEASYTVQLTVK